MQHLTFNNIHGFAGVINDFVSLAGDDVLQNYEDIKKTYDFLTVDTTLLKSIG